ncbi:MAG: hypothetical protein ACOX5G_13570 [Kiritimatiellia bacterium]|jgi:hypothetical protein
MAHEWNIRPRGRLCTLCGKPFEDGQECVSALYDRIDGFVREDSCMPCWAGRATSSGEQPISVWQGTFAAPDEAGKTEPVPKESAEQLLRRLIGLDDPAQAPVAYVLAVMLERSRQLVERDARPHESGGTLRVYEHRKTGDVFTVLDPHLRLDAIADVQRQVVELLGGSSDASGDTAAPPPPAAAATDAAPAEPPEVPSSAP